MTEEDISLLKLAAKAYGIKKYVVRSKAFLISDDEGDLDAWNPLSVDAHAFRLAAKLRINVFHYVQHVNAERMNADGGMIQFTQAVENQSGRLKKTRQVIVAVAAEMGRRMK